MSTNARSWFYEQPEAIPYLVVERLNATFWQARVVQVLFSECTQAEPPIQVRGFWRDEPIELEWQPRQWISLRGASDLAEFIPLLSHVVGFKPAFRYQDGDDRYVYEWHRNAPDGQVRWQAIQGKPLYKHPERLNAA